jgi:hypothetical protein
MVETEKSKSAEIFRGQFLGVVADGRRYPGFDRLAIVRSAEPTPA